MKYRAGLTGFRSRRYACQEFPDPLTSDKLSQRHAARILEQLVQGPILIW
jgi:hypothetical protein